MSDLRLVEADGAGAMFAVVEDIERRPCPAATPEEVRDAWRLPRVSFDAEEAYSDRHDDYRDYLFRIPCPTCSRTTAPFMRRDQPKRLVSEWEWVGIDYKQPFTDFLCECAKCGAPFVLHVYSPQ